MSNWIFEHDRLLDPSWHPAPGQTWRKDAPKASCEVTWIQHGMVHFRYLGERGTGPFKMPIERWRTLGPVERKCSDCGDWDVLVGTDCCDGPKFECRTQVILDGAGDPDVTVCRDGHGCAA